MSIETIIRSIPSVKKGGLYGIKLSLSEMILISEEYNAAESAMEQANQAVMAASETIKKLVAEGEAMREALSGVMTHCPINDPDIDKACAAMICNDALQSTPNTDAFTAELRAQGVDELIADRKSEWMVSYCEDAADFADNLRAGRKG